MNIYETLYELRLPAKAVPGQTYTDALQERILHAARILSQLDDRMFSSSFYASLHEIIEKGYTENNFLIECAKSFANGDIEKAKTIFDASIESTAKVYFDLGTNSLMTDGLYRLRVANGFEPLRKELFHVPEEKKNVCPENRFSPKANPCLYLASSTNVAWLESKMPLKFYISRFWQREITIGWKILFLIPPQNIYLKLFSEAALYNGREGQENVLLLYFQQLPLVIACSFVARPEEKICDGEKTYLIPEYQIPQLLMSWIKENPDSKEVKGIAYYSSAQYADYQRCVGFNVVLPVFEFGDNGYCRILQKAFIMTKPKLVDMSTYINAVNHAGEKYLSEYDLNFDKIDVPNWDTLKAATLAIKYFITREFFAKEQKDDGEMVYVLLMSIRSTFRLLKMISFKDIHGNSMVTLDNAVCQLSDALDHLLDSITQISCTEGAVGEEQFRERFDYIEGVDLSDA